MYEAIHTDVDGPGNLQEYGALNISRSRGVWKRGDWCEKIMENQPSVSDGSL